MNPTRVLSFIIMLPLALVVAAGCSSSDDDATSSSGGQGGAGGASSTATTTGGSTTTSGGGGDMEPANMQGITAAHNAARASVNPPAPTPIPPLVWSSEVAAVAQAYAEKCVFEHSQSPYGENLYASSGSSTPTDVVDSWVSEVADYDYASNKCSGICGHYTQVVWANTSKLGCGMANCTTGSPFGSGSWQIWVCNYDPPGNYIGQKPY